MGILPKSEATKMDTPFWNKVDLTPPPVCTLKSNSSKELGVLNGAIKEIIATLDSFDIMLYETKFVSTVIKQYQADLRTDKSFQLVTKITHCLKKCRLLNIKEVFLNYEKTSAECNTFDYQPSRQMLEYVLVRIQGFIMLLKSLVDMCHNCALNLKGKMEIGHFPSIVLTLFAVVSRIWSLSKYFIENAFEWYLLLLPLLECLQPTQVNWLPSGYKFPALPLDLNHAPWINQDKVIRSLSSFLSKHEEPTNPRSNLDFLIKSDDLGETISRSEVTANAERRLAVKNVPMDKKSHVGNVTIQKKGNHPQNKPQVKASSSAQPKPNPKRRKRKLSETESAQPVKHFFKAKYSKPGLVLNTQDSELKQPRPNSVKVLDNEVSKSDSAGIMQQLANLKKDLAVLSGKTAETKPVGLDPKYKRKVVVVQTKKSSVSHESSSSFGQKSLKTGTQYPPPALKTVSKPAKVGGSDCDTISSFVGSLPVIDSRKKREPASKELPIQRRMEKRKEKAKTKKKKSNSWVIS